MYNRFPNSDTRGISLRHPSGCFFGKLLFLTVLSIFAARTLVGQSSYDLRSPNKRIEVRIRTAGTLRYDVVLNGKALLENSTLSLDVEHKKLGVDAKVIEAKERSYDQLVKPAVRQKFAQIRDNYNELRIAMDGGYAVVLRAYNEG